MSTQPLSAASMTPPDVTAALTRIAQIEQMTAAAASGFAQTGGSAAPSSSAAGFSNVLASAASAAPASASATSGAQTSYASIIDGAATTYGIDPAILTALVNQESGFNPNAVSSAGAEGLTQVMPENFAADGITDPFDPTQSIYGGAKQLAGDLAQFGGNYADALAAYNAGSAAVTQYGGVPPYAQTQNYVADILSSAARYEQQPQLEQSPAASPPTTTTGAIA
jgi:soluble lytic murein transglycosylase-like protein